jgi:hypothetical protein
MRNFLFQLRNRFSPNILGHPLIARTPNIQGKLLAARINLNRCLSAIGRGAICRLESAGVEFIDGNGGGPRVRLLMLPKHKR